MKRLSWQWVNRLLVLVALLLPIVYVVLWAFNLKGVGVVPTSYDYDFATRDIFDYILDNNPLNELIHSTLEDGNWFGFDPINQFLAWLDDFLSHPAFSTYINASLINTLMGYMWWVFHVLLFDVLINGVTFFFRFIKKLMYMFEKED